MKYLCDSNVFLALAIGQHTHHSTAAAWFANLASSDTALFCTATRISFLRLLTQPIAPGYVPLTHSAAWALLDRLMEDDATGFEREPELIESTWRNLSETQTSSPKVWMDAYLAAFAIAGNLRLITFDKDFRKFTSKGLDLVVLSS